MGSVGVSPTKKIDLRKLSGVNSYPRGRRHVREMRFRGITPSSRRKAQRADVKRNIKATIFGSDFCHTFLRRDPLEHAREFSKSLGTPPNKKITF